jgi:hypothetical protein
VLRRGIGAWSSRRARMRARRALIRERIQAATFDTVELELELQLEEDESIDDRLLERISGYTRSEMPQPAVTGSLRAIVTGPGFAAPTTHTENV